MQRKKTFGPDRKSNIDKKAQYKGKFFSDESLVSPDGRLESYFPWANKGISLLDPKNPIRNQESIGSCQSFAWLGLIENRVFLDQGVTLDLSERYQLYSNFMEFSDLGAQPQHILQFPNSFERWGALPESAYPYQAIAQNAPHFAVDTAQGLATSTATPEINASITGKTSAEKSKVLQEARFFGPLPDYISVPIQVLNIDKDRWIPRLVRITSTGETANCFSLNPSVEKSLSISAPEFAQHCLMYKKSEVKTAYPLSIFAGLSCDKISPDDKLPAYAKAFANQRLNNLQMILNSLINERPSLVGFPVPKIREIAISAVWYKGIETFSGHAVLAVGYITPRDIQSLEKQNSGFFESLKFDEIAKNYDSQYVPPPATLNNEIKQKIRQESKFAKLIQDQQGVLIIRNS